jgi:hypothetical protein
LLINDELIGVVLNKNNLYVSDFSNVNARVLYAVDDVNVFSGNDADLLVGSTWIDCRHAFIELNYASVWDEQDHRRDSQYAAVGATQFYGPLTLAGRALFKWGDRGGRGPGELFVLESNFTRFFSDGLPHHLGIEQGVFYCNAFHSTAGWNSIAGGNYDRLRSAFVVNPLVELSISRDPARTSGVSLGVELFRHHQDEQIIPEFAYEAPQGRSVWAAGLIYQRKTGKRTFFSASGITTWSSDEAYVRRGVFLGETIVF